VRGDGAEVRGDGAEVRGDGAEVIRSNGMFFLYIFEKDLTKWFIVIV
jgi:hypothetical protein